MSDKIDFSSLDPALDEARWEARVAETLEQGSLLAQQDLSLLDSERGTTGSAAWLASLLEQAELLGEQDLSSLSSPTDDALVASLLEQAELLGEQDLSPTRAAELGSQAGVASVMGRVGPSAAAHEPSIRPLARVGADSLPPSVASPVVELAPRAIVLAACLAAAAWLLVWLSPPQPVAAEDPALALMSWAESGDSLTADQMRVVTGEAP
ncbi:MAG: hypothetical protein AB8I08_26175 [Sandaracinaceae bacterium]